MEGSVVQAILPSTNLQDSSTANKDCYFYYYSSCTKGHACPFRHEPSALRNETMCVYWLKGSCNKPHCIYRHMEITKNRNKIPCFFESQPGGCKKLHCPFFHNNVQDQPREEDVPNKPDLILPVKDSELEYETEESEIKKLENSISAQLKLQRKLCQNRSTLNKDKESNPESPTPSVIRKSFIVPLQDAESDSESVSVSPVKPMRHERRCVMSGNESDWELERLKEIQEEEGNLLGYFFTTKEDQEDDSLAISQFSPSLSYEDDEDLIDEEDEYDDSHIMLRRSFHLKSQKPNKEKLGGYVKKVLGDAIMRPGTEMKRVRSNLLLQNDSTIEQPKSHKRLKPSVKERLGKLSSEEESEIGNGVVNKTEDFMKTRHGLKERNVKSRLLKNEDVTKTANPRNTIDNISIKSLADIRAEKERQKQNGCPKSLIKYTQPPLPLSALIDNKRIHAKDHVDIGNLKIKTLAEIKAEKKKVSLPNKIPSKISKPQNQQRKRSYSPISFDDSSIQKKLKQSDERKDIENKKLSTKFNSRKLALKKATDAGSGDLKIKKHKPTETTSAINVLTQGSASSCNDEPALEKLSKRSNKVNDSASNKNVSNSSNQNRNNSEKCDSANDSKTRLKPSRLDSFIDEEELLLVEDLSHFDDDDDDEIDEDELLL